MQKINRKLKQMTGSGRGTYCTSLNDDVGKWVLEHRTGCLVLVGVDGDSCSAT